jgi:hypothetical protein
MMDWMVLVVINGKEYLERICWSKEKAEELAEELNKKATNGKTYKVVNKSDNF